MALPGFVIPMSHCSENLLPSGHSTTLSRPSKRFCGLWMITSGDGCLFFGVSVARTISGGNGSGIDMSMTPSTTIPARNSIVQQNKRALVEPGQSQAVAAIAISSAVQVAFQQLLRMRILRSCRSRKFIAWVLYSKRGCEKIVCI